MSATNRGTERNDQDFYPTPLSAFMPLIPYLPKVRIWEPAQGNGRLVRAMVSSGLDAYGSDLNPQAPGERSVDFFTAGTDAQCITTNPPFSRAFEFCQRSVSMVAHTYLLMRLNFLASGRRRAWFTENEPNALFVLSDRPSFCKSVKCAAKCGYQKLFAVETAVPASCPTCGSKVKVTKSDSCEYAWYYWGGSSPAHNGIYHL